MILSETHRFIFIKGRKVGGTSVEIALSTLCGANDIIAPITPIDEVRRLGTAGVARNYSLDPGAEATYIERLRQAPPASLAGVAKPPSQYFAHMPLRAVLQAFGPAARDYRVICVERHPYAKILSWANHRLTFAGYRSGGEMWPDPGDLRMCLRQIIADRSVVKVKNIDLYRGPDGRVVAEVLRYEQLEADFHGFVRSLGAECQTVQPHAKKGLLSNGLDPRDFLARQEIALINELFAEEFQAFHYEPL